MDYLWQSLRHRSGPRSREGLMVLRLFESGDEVSCFCIVRAHLVPERFPGDERGLVGVGPAAADAHPFGCTRPGVADRQKYAAEVGHQVDPALPVELLPLRPAHGSWNLTDEFFRKEAIPSAIYPLLLLFVPRSVPGKRRFFILNSVYLRSEGSC